MLIRLPRQKPGEAPQVVNALQNRFCEGYAPREVLYIFSSPLQYTLVPPVPFGSVRIWANSLAKQTFLPKSSLDYTIEDIHLLSSLGTKEENSVAATVCQLALKSRTQNKALQLN